VSIEYRVISIGCLAAHPLWHERGAVRTDHATTTLVTTGSMKLLVDPSLPAPALAARLHERSGLQPDAVTHVFLTSFEPFRRRGRAAFEHATWLMSEAEHEAAAVGLRAATDQAEAAGDRELLASIATERAMLEQVGVAPDSLAPGVDLFPLPGVTAGTCALLLALPGRTVLICGDAVPTWEHLAQGAVLPRCADPEQAMESFREAVEIADLLVLGRDNIAVNPLRPMA
jgi:glyoxylase-like metal-dependent hydrolase (beta-lactamase superfamily II)